MLLNNKPWRKNSFEFNRFKNPFTELTFSFRGYYY